MKRLLAARLLATVALPLALTVAACSSEEPAPPTTTAAASAAKTAPTAQQAHDIIARSGEFSQYEFTNAAVSLPVAGSSMNEPTRDTARQLAAAGWLEFDASGDLMLTNKSRKDKRFILRENGLLDVVPLARKEMGDVTAVRTSADGSVTADFSWRWIPNEVGTAFTRGPIHDRYAASHNARATLMWNGTEWTMITIEPM
jgi:hypothetical protein